MFRSSERASPGWFGTDRVVRDARSSKSGTEQLKLQTSNIAHSSQPVLFLGFRPEFRTGRNGNALVKEGLKDLMMPKDVASGRRRRRKIRDRNHFFQEDRSFGPR